MNEIAIEIETPLQDDVRSMVAALNAHLIPLTPREFQFQLTVEQMAEPASRSWSPATLSVGLSAWAR